MTEEVDQTESELFRLLSEYARRVTADVRVRLDSWPLDPERNNVHEVVGGLLSRQLQLATTLVLSPPIWTPDIAPLVLRSMVDLHVTLSWIFLAPAARSEQFIRYGLGQVKLSMEHLKSMLKVAGEETESNPAVKAMQQWIDGQRFHFLTEVNVGNWAETDLRSMATECECELLYKRDFQMWSACTHNMWHHLYEHNLVPCKNPLHSGGHRVARLSFSRRSELQYPGYAVDYLDLTLQSFDKFRGVIPTSTSSGDWLDQELEALGDRIKADPKS
jgi:hypothetical protein